MRRLKGLLNKGHRSVRNIDLDPEVQDMKLISRIRRGVDSTPNLSNRVNALQRKGLVPDGYTTDANSLRQILRSYTNDDIARRIELQRLKDAGQNKPYMSPDELREATYIWNRRGENFDRRLEEINQRRGTSYNRSNPVSNSVSNAPPPGEKSLNTNRKTDESPLFSSARARNIAIGGGVVLGGGLVFDAYEKRNGRSNSDLYRY